jgi:hypothetical protein
VIGPKAGSRDDDRRGGDDENESTNVTAARDHFLHNVLLS